MAPNAIAVIRRSKLDRLSSSHAAEITDVKHLSSYNWIERDEPTIAIPGLPPSWSPTKGSRRVPQDSGLIYIAQNAARHPDSPVEPLFRSLYELHPTFDIRSVDIVSERNNIRKLLKFVTIGGPELEPFAIRVQHIKDTMIFCRTERETTQFLGARDFCGYGHEFEKAYTADGLGGDSTGHHRVISYRFCGMNIIICHETDAYIENQTATSKDELAAPAQKTTDVSRLIYSSAPGSKLGVFPAGETVPIESTLEIKTRSVRKPLNFEQVAPQLWISQTPNLVRAYHMTGLFSEPKVENVSKQIQDWEKLNQSDLKKLGGVLQWIAAATKALGKATVKYRVTDAQLIVEKSIDSANLLPEDLCTKWDAW